MKVELQRIRHRYPYEKQDIFEDVSFVCENLQKIGVLAESQSGKTTLVRIAAGLLSPTDGTVRYDGIDRVKLKGSAWTERRRGIGICVRVSLTYVQEAESPPSRRAAIRFWIFGFIRSLI